MCDIYLLKSLYLSRLMKHAKHSYMHDSDLNFFLTLLLCFEKNKALEIENPFSTLMLFDIHTYDEKQNI